MDQAEGQRAVHREHGVPLRVGHLVHHAILGVARVVDDDVILVVAAMA